MIGKGLSHWLLLLLLWCLAWPVASWAQSVTVTLSLATNKIDVGSGTVLRAFAQIVPAERASSDRIFSWYVDLLDASGNVALPEFAALTKAKSDQDTQTSSRGVIDGANLRGIYDTFLNLAAAGRDAPVELFSVPIKGLTPGRCRFSIQPGSSVPGLGADFIVAPSEAIDPLFGGDYTAASAELEVLGPLSDTRLEIVKAQQPGGGGGVTVSFTTAPGRNYTVEARNDLRPATAWQALPNAPHNTGAVSDPNNSSQRFYRLRISN